MQLFVSGDSTQVGKSSVCLAILGTLLKSHGYAASELAYIKPCTQCESVQLVHNQCRRWGIDCVPIGPVVFYKGFTRSFLRGETKTSEQLIAEAVAAVRAVSVGKRFVLIDGVGYPSVGSVCGISNADVAAGLGAPVLIVSKHGVGNAVDSFNLNACYFQQRGVRVLGCIFNRFPARGFYSLDECQPVLQLYFDSLEKKRNDTKKCERMYGCLPEQPELVAASEDLSAVCVIRSAPSALAGAKIAPAPALVQGAASSTASAAAVAAANSSLADPSLVTNTGDVVAVLSDLVANTAVSAVSGAELDEERKEEARLLQFIAEFERRVDVAQLLLDLQS